MAKGGMREEPVVRNDAVLCLFEFGAHQLTVGLLRKPSNFSLQLLPTFSTFELSTFFSTATKYKNGGRLRYRTS